MSKAPDGTVIKMQDGSTRVKRGGQWISAGNLFQGAAPKMTTQENQQLATVREGAAGAEGAIEQIDRFMTLNQKTPTGQIAGMQPYRSLRAAFDPNVAQMNAIVEKLTPAQREPGSGPMSDPDIAMYRASVIGVDKPGPANTKIAALARAGEQRRRDYAAYMDYYARLNGTLNGAQEQWDSYSAQEPVYDHKTGTARTARSWRRHFGIDGQPKPPRATAGTGPPQGTQAPAQRPATPGRVRVYNPQTGRLE